MKGVGGGQEPTKPPRSVFYKRKKIKFQISVGIIDKYPNRYLWIIYPQILKFYFSLIKKAKEGLGRLLTPLQPLSLTPLNKKNFDFQGSPLWFFIALKICG